MGTGRSRSRGASVVGDRESHRAARRAEMVQAATRAVRRLGAGVSVAQIAEVAGITKPVLYRFFTDRADLQRAVGEQAVAAVAERITRELRGDREPVEHVRAVIDAFLAGIDEDPQLWRFVLRDPVVGGVEAEVVEDAREQIARSLAAVLDERLRERGLESEGAQVWAHGLVGMVHGAAVWWLRRRTMSRTALTDQLTALAWGGLTGVFGTRAAVENACPTPVRLTRGSR